MYTFWCNLYAVLYYFQTGGVRKTGTENGSFHPTPKKLGQNCSSLLVGNGMFRELREVFFSALVVKVGNGS